jgi:AcrR family transcriptional regulator
MSGRDPEMGKLIDQERRARARGARKERMRLIRKAAREAFDRQAFADVSLESIGRRAGLKDGLPALYFGSKEELYLQLVSDEIRDWLEKVARMLDDASCPIGIEALTDLLGRSLGGRPLLQRLLAQLVTVVEQTTDIGATLAFQHGLEERLTGAGTRLEEECSELGRGRGARLLHRTLLLAIGLGATARWLEPGNQSLKVDLERELSVYLAAAARDGSQG